MQISVEAVGATWTDLGWWEHSWCGSRAFLPAPLCCYQRLHTAPRDITVQEQTKQTKFEKTKLFFFPFLYLE